MPFEGCNDKTLRISWSNRWIYRQILRSVQEWKTPIESPLDKSFPLGLYQQGFFLLSLLSLAYQEISIKFISGGNFPLNQVKTVSTVKLKASVFTGLIQNKLHGYHGFRRFKEVCSHAAKSFNPDRIFSFLKLLIAAVCIKLIGRFLWFDATLLLAGDR